jgi:phosphatidylinositol alpha-1,6-mannosyltransferase
MKILFLATDFKPNTGGIAEVAYQVCRELGARGHEVTAMTVTVDGLPAMQTMETFQVRRMLPPIPRTGTKLGRLLRRWLRERRARHDILDFVGREQPDILFAGNYHSSWPAILPRTGRPWFIFLHGEEVARTRATRVPFRRRRMRRVIMGAAGTFWNSQYSRSLGEKLCGASPPRPTVTGCGFPVEGILENPDRAAARQRLGWNAGPVLLTVGRLVPRKGVGTVIAAMPEVLKKFPACRYAVIGDGPARAAFERQAHGLGLTGQVEFMGHVPEVVKRDAYVAADVFLMPSRSTEFSEVEGFGISFLEANAHGLPVIGSTQGGVPDAVSHGENGLLVDPQDMTGVADAVCALLDDPVARRTMAAAGQRRIRERFNWPAIVDLIETRLLESVRE